MSDLAPILTMALQAVIAAVLASFTASMQRNRTALERIATQIADLAVAVARQGTALEGYEKRFEMHARDVERRLGVLEEHVLLTRRGPE